MQETNTQQPIQEHLLVCLSSSPSNARIVRTAARMADAFNCSFTALYVERYPDDLLSKEDKARLQASISLAEQLGARIVTVSGEDVANQIAEFARLSKVTKIVLGHSSVNQRNFIRKETLTEQLCEAVPNIDIYIIPDGKNNTSYRKKNKALSRRILPTYKDLLITIFTLALSTGICEAFHALNFTEANIVTVYILGVLIASLFTQNYICNVISSLGAVLFFNFLFTEPRFTLHAYSSGYPVTFIIMLSTSIIIGSLAVKLREHASISARTAYRTRVLFDTNTLLQGVQEENEIYDITASQLVKLLDCIIVVYIQKQNQLEKYNCYPANSESDTFSQDALSTATECLRKGEPIFDETQKMTKILYSPVTINEKKFGVIAIDLKETHLSSLDKGVVNSILGECALAIDNIRNSIEKEKQTAQARSEQLRANLLRTISHDLKTPLTAISGNAEYLLTNQVTIDTAKQIYTDIYNDAIWLNSLVENLLSITHLEKGRSTMSFSTELIEDIINEAVSRVNLKNTGHKLSVKVKDELLLVKVDTRLVVQVIINLIVNAVKYSPPNTQIVITAQKQDNKVVVSVADNGNGIADEEKEKVFEMFYTGGNIADSRRSLGLGLSLCKTIVGIHGGTITLTDNKPQGSIFSFTLPIGEVKINE